MDFNESMKRNLKLFFFNITSKYIDTIIAQTETIKLRLKEQYNFKKILVIPNSISNINIKPQKKEFNFPKNKTLFFYPCVYHIHKNLEILIPLSKKIRELKLSYCIITTIDKNDSFLAKSS